jgi:glycosyltransferase involved in cell wall biosynthesis
MNPKVTVITASTGNPLLARNIESVQKQTYDNIQHLVVVDGPDHKIKVDNIFWTVGNPRSQLDVIQLPYATGINRFNGHRIYGACPYLAEGDWIIFLDDDNSIEPNHIESCLKTIEEQSPIAPGVQWCFSHRNIVDKDHNFICKDLCESLGLWPSILSPDDYFIDVNCYFLRKDIALAMSPVWYRKFREPGQMEIDRAMFHVLKNMMKTSFATTGKYTVNYSVGNSPLSVQKEFFLEGNKAMLARYNGKPLPWNYEGGDPA